MARPMAGRASDVDGRDPLALLGAIYVVKIGLALKILASKSRPIGDRCIGSHREYQRLALDWSSPLRRG